MSSYLEDYGASEERRAKRTRLIKLGFISTISVVFVALIFYGVFKNHSEQQQAKAFVASLIAQDYQGAYRMFGCTDTSPCRDYPFNKFLDDWGPKSTHADESSAHIGLSQSCGSAVVWLWCGRTKSPPPLSDDEGTREACRSVWRPLPDRRFRPQQSGQLRHLFHLRSGSIQEPVFAVALARGLGGVQPFAESLHHSRSGADALARRRLVPRNRARHLSKHQPY